jgi:ornithine cyclodeaminase/alanine dehydrogenase-like protein (mu-crystallin family)
MNLFNTNQSKLDYLANFPFQSSYINQHMHIYLIKSTHMHSNEFDQQLLHFAYLIIIQ